MRGRVKVFFGTLIAAIAVGIAVFVAVSALDSFDLKCTLVGPSGSDLYAFHVQTPKFAAPRMTFVGTNTHDMRVVRLDATTIIAELVDTKLSGWPEQADAISFRFNRISGDAEMDYLQKPDQPGPVPWWFVMEGLSQKGTCSKSTRAF